MTLGPLFAISFLGLVVLALLAYWAVAKLLWLRDLREAVADLDYDCRVRQITGGTQGYYSRAVPHRYVVEFHDGMTKEVHVPYHWAWPVTVPLNRSVTKTRQIRKRNAELEQVVLDLGTELDDDLIAQIHSATARKELSK